MHPLGLGSAVGLLVGEDSLQSTEMVHMAEKAPFIFYSWRLSYTCMYVFIHLQCILIIPPSMLLFQLSMVYHPTLLSQLFFSLTLKKF